MTIVCNHLYTVFHQSVDSQQGTNIVTNGSNERLRNAIHKLTHYNNNIYLWVCEREYYEIREMDFNEYYDNMYNMRTIYVVCSAARVFVVVIVRDNRCAYIF